MLFVDESQDYQLKFIQFLCLLDIQIVQNVLSKSNEQQYNFKDAHIGLLVPIQFDKTRLSINLGIFYY